jgi:hypothetical protein
MGSTIEVILTILGLSFWILFPIGIFLSVSHVDKNTDQLVRLEELRHESLPEQDRYREVTVEHFDWHHPVLSFRKWLQHD